jgi:hypothetical protein
LSLCILKCIHAQDSRRRPSFLSSLPRTVVDRDATPAKVPETVRGGDRPGSANVRSHPNRIDSMPENSTVLSRSSRRTSAMIARSDRIMDSGQVSLVAKAGLTLPQVQFAALDGATTARLHTSPAWLSVVSTECRDAKVARGGAGEAQRARDPGTAFQSSDANLTKFRAIAAVNHANKHNRIGSMCIAEFPALPGTGSTRGDTGLNLLLVHGELSMTSGLPAKCVHGVRSFHGVMYVQF